jgi:hypothetical protein
VECIAEEVILLKTNWAVIIVCAQSGRNKNSPIRGRNEFHPES